MANIPGAVTDPGSIKAEEIRFNSGADSIPEVSEFLCVRLGQSHPPLGERL
jgi:hypothetical protein